MSRPPRLGAYAKLSATYYRDDAILRAGEAAEVLFTRSLAFCAESSSDGYITDLQVTHVVGIGLKKLADRVAALVREGLWERIDGGYLVRSWLKWNRSAEEVGMARKRDRERKARPDSERNDDGIQPESERNPKQGVAHKAPDSLSETGQDRTGQETTTGVSAETLRRKRPPDMLWDAVMAACSIDSSNLTDSARGAANRAVAELRGVKADPSDVPKRAQRYRERFPGATLTPTALARHWAECAPIASVVHPDVQMPAFDPDLPGPVYAAAVAEWQRQVAAGRRPSAADVLAVVAS